MVGARDWRDMRKEGAMSQGREANCEKDKRVVSLLQPPTETVSPL